MLIQARYVCSYSETHRINQADAHSRFDNLLMRFEEPSSMVRWDSPLISIPWDEDPPYEEIWNIVMKGEKKGPTAATLQVS